MHDDDWDAFIAEHAERATRLADAVRLRPDAPARQVAPLGVGRAGPGRAPGRRRPGSRPRRSTTPSGPQRWRPAALPLPDRLVHARALLQIGRIAEALHDAEKIVADAADDAAHPGRRAAAGRAGAAWRSATARPRYRLLGRRR